eukprot:6205269-Pleurochrysis_carterae.AAC.3
MGPHHLLSDLKRVVMTKGSKRARKGRHHHDDTKKGRPHPNDPKMGRHHLSDPKMGHHDKGRAEHGMFSDMNGSEGQGYAFRCSAQGVSFTRATVDFVRTTPQGLLSCEHPCSLPAR